jgi:hypothetical protein
MDRSVRRALAPEFEGALTDLRTDLLELELGAAQAVDTIDYEQAWDLFESRCMARRRAERMRAEAELQARAMRLRAEAIAREGLTSAPAASYATALELQRWQERPHAWAEPAWPRTAQEHADFLASYVARNQ